jgi:outer membrane biosynthesis protein TonB
VLNAQLVGTIASPLTGLVRTLNALIAGIAIQLQAIVDMSPPDLEGGEAEPEPETQAAAEPEQPTQEPEQPEADTAAADESEA